MGASEDAGAGGTRAELFVLSGPDVGRSFNIGHGATVGRAPDRDVVLRDRSISRHHAHFECSAGVWSIVDDGSTNGFVVDGARHERATLQDLREFVIGEILVRLRTEFSGAPAASPRPAAPAGLPPVSSAGPSSPPAPTPTQSGFPAPTASRAQDLGDEIEIDSDPESTVPSLRSPPRATSAPSFGERGRTGPSGAEPGGAGSAGGAGPSVVRPISAPAAKLASSGAGAAGNLGARGQSVLQYHKQPARTGLLVTDLDQRPLWVRILSLALVVVLAAALAYGAYRGVLSLREGLESTEPPAEAGG